MSGSGQPLRLALVGHTNTGKTSLLQTLLRRRDIGEVSAHGGTTRAVEAGEVADDAGVVAVLLDTPGIEESDRLRDALESEQTDRYDDPRTLLDRFLASPAAADVNDLGLEAASVRAALSADVLLYAIDAREDLKPKHLDELTVLAATARPLIPVLNYAAHPDAQPESWRGACARQGLHATVAFDAVVYDDRRRVPGRVRGARRHRIGARGGRGQRPQGAAAAARAGRGPPRRRGRGAARGPGGGDHPRRARPRPRGDRAGPNRGGGEREPRARRGPGLAGVVGGGARAGGVERSLPTPSGRRSRPRPRGGRQERGRGPGRPDRVGLATGADRVKQLARRLVARSLQ